MTTIGRSEFRDLVQRIAAEPTIGRQNVNQLVDAAMQDGTLGLSEREALQTLLVDHADKIDTPETKQKLEAFLSISDGKVRELAHLLEQEDGVLDIADADKLASLVQGDGAIDGSEKYSLRAVMLGAKMTPEAEGRLKELSAGAGDDPPKSVSQTARPDLDIPDNSPAGAAHTMRFEEAGVVGDLEVELDLEHTYRGDLDVRLVAPDGTEVTLHKTSGGGDDDLVGVYPTDLKPAQSLEVLKGKPIAGDWTLKVVDTMGADIGALHGWRLAFAPRSEEPPPTTVKGSSQPNIDIPDQDPTGVKDTLTLAGDGLIDNLKVDLDLEHTYRGDLLVTLVAPDGTEVKLHDRSGGGSDHLKGSYPGTLAPAQALDQLKGKRFAGPWQLWVSDHAGQDLGTLKSWAIEVTPKGGGGGGDAVEMGATDAGKAAYLSAAGFFVEDKALEAPRNNVELGSGLYRMAEVVDDVRANPFTGDSLPLALQEKALDQLKETLAIVPPGGAPPEGLDAIQALQLRSSAVTVLRAMVAGAEGAGAEGALKQAAFETYRAAVEAETDPTLRDSMIFNLFAIKDKLTSEMKPVVDRFINEIAPVKPPYDDWFKDGNRTLNVSWTSGQGTEGFYRGTVAMLKDRGFVPEGTEREGGPCTYAKEMTDRNGETYTVRIKCKENRDSIFEDMGDDSFHIVGYDGHSNFGRNIPDSMAYAPEEAGKKVIFYGLCAGKDNIHRVRGKYPDSQVLTTFTSSYFNTKEVDGRKQMSRSENFNALMVLVEDAVERRPWTQINKDLRDKAILFPWSHVMPGGTNFVSPVHTMIRRRVLDLDHDGQADYLDKLVDFNTFEVREDTRREFVAEDPGRPASKIDGTRAHIAAMGLNTETGYNSVTKDYKKGNIIGDGYFEPAPGERAIVKFEEAEVDGAPVLYMRTNKNYAHMSADALRAVASYQFIQNIADDISSPRMDAVDRKLMGLVFATASIAYDTGYWTRDQEIWDGVLEAFNLPADLPFEPIKRMIDDEHHDYTGSMTHVRKWKEQISAEALEALKRDDVGIP